MNGDPGAAQRHGSRARLRRRLAAVGLGFTVAVLLAFAAAELYLRTAGSQLFGGIALYQGLWENDGRGGIRPVAGFVKHGRVLGSPFEIRLNSLGMRGEEPGVKRDGDFRLLVLGDSMAFGHGVAVADAFPARLESELSAVLGRRVCVGNAALPMNGTVDEARDLVRLLDPFAPDAVLVCFYLGNDFVDNLYGPKEVVAGFVVNTQMARFYRSSLRARAVFHSRVAFELERRLADAFPGFALSRRAMESTADERGRFDDLPRGSWEEGLFMDVKELTDGLERVLDRVEGALAEMRTRAGTLPVLVAILPTHSRVWPGAYFDALQRNFLDPDAHRRDLAQARVAERCARLGIPTIDLTPCLRAEQVRWGTPDATFLPGDFHLSPGGHAAVARALAPFVAEELRARGVVR